jgi:hypothetical protein
MNCHETKHKETAMKTLSIAAMTVFAFLALANFASAQDRQKERFQVSSTTFEDGATMPSSAIYNLQFNGVNVCSLDGSPGGNESPELSWTNAPAIRRVSS